MQEDIPSQLDFVCDSCLCSSCLLEFSWMRWSCEDDNAEGVLVVLMLRM